MMRTESKTKADSAYSSSIAVMDWIDSSTNEQNRLPVVLGIARELIAGLRPGHDSGDYVAGLSDASIFIQLPEGTPYVDRLVYGDELRGGCESNEDDLQLVRSVYMAPELSGVLQAPIEASTDLYSVGVFLYRAICGRNPIEASSVSELLLGQMTQSISSLRLASAAVPRCVDEFILRLLKRDPRDRYRTIDAALCDLQKIIEFTEGIQCDPIVLGKNDRRERLIEASLVGRDDWVDRFLQWIADHTRRSNQLLIVGKSGIGKTRLIDEFAKVAKANGATVFRTNGIDSERSRPLEAFQSISRDLEQFCKNNPALFQFMLHGLVKHREGIQALFPWLFEGHAELVDIGPAEFAGIRIKRAFHELFRLLNNQPNRIVILIDNLDRIDPLSRELLVGWLKNRTSQNSGSLLVVATGLPSNAIQLQDDLDHSAVLLDPLSSEGISEVLRSMIGQFPEDVINLVAGASAGNPSLAISMLRGIIDSQGVILRGDAWERNTRRELVLQSQGQSRESVIQRIHGIPERVFQFLTAGAILGSSFRFLDVKSLSMFEIQDSLDCIETAVQLQLLWSNHDHQMLGFVHDDVRHYLLDRLDPNGRKQLHLRAVKLINQDNEDCVYDLAYHFDAAGYSEEAISHSILAAERALKQYANEQAVAYYRLALKWVPDTDRELRRKLSESIGEIFLSTGKYDSADDAFQEASFFADNQLDSTRILGRLGDIEFKRGRMKQAANNYVAALSLSGANVPRWTIAMLFLLIFQSLIQAKNTVFGLPRNRRVSLPIHRLRWTLYSRLAHTFWFSRGALWTLYAHLTGMNDAERFEDTSELAKSYSEHAPVCTLLRSYRRAEQYSLRSLAIHTAENNTWGQGQTLAYASVVPLAEARFAKCIKTASQGIELLERTGDAWETNMARYQRAVALYRSGRYREAINDAKLIHDNGVAIGDAQAAGISLDVWVRCAPQQVAFEVVKRQASIERSDAQSHAQTQLAFAIMQLRENQFQEAESSLREAIARCKAAGHLNTYISPCYAWLATVLRTAAGSTPRSQAHVFQRRIRLAKRAASKALRIARSFPADLPHVFRELAMISSLQGNVSEAIKSYRKSISIAERLNCPMQAWESLSFLKVYINGLESDAWQLTRSEIDRLDQLSLSCAESIRCHEGTIATVENLSLADRFDNLLADGRCIARSLNRDDIFHQCCLAAQHLLRGQIAMILEPDMETGKWNVLKVLSSNSITNKYLTEFTNESEFIDHIGERNATCVMPWYIREQFTEGCVLSTQIRVRDSIAAYLLVGHMELDNLFGSEELQVAEFIATLTSAALENAEGFEKLHKLNATLEQRVKERTAAAELRATQLNESNQNLQKTEEQLREAIEIANGASQAKSRFLATMSHEIRTPLNGIIGMTQLALASSPNPQHTNYLSTIHRSGTSLMHLLNDLLDFSKIEAGRMTVEAIEFSPIEVLKDVVGLMSIAAWQKQIEVVAYVAPDLPARMIGDPMRLRQVILNLIGNAIKFTSKGHVEMRVELPPNLDGHWQIRVIDTGIGIPRDKQSSIFTAFSQADNSTTRRFGGTGLGLSISSELVHLMNGVIDVSSRVNHGSEFTITLPIQVDPTLDSRPVAPPTRFAGVAVLLVEPNDGARRCLEQTLTDYGARVISYDTWHDKPEFDRVDWELIDLVIAAGPEAESIIHEAEARGIQCWLAMSPTSEKTDMEKSLIKPVYGSEPIEKIANSFRDRNYKEFEETSTTTVDANDVPAKAAMHILVAEDGIVNQCVVVGLLELLGHRATVANDGREAVELLAKEKFDLCFMDLDMPVLDGIQATLQIREMGHSIPIYAMTAHHDRKYSELCHEVGMNGFLTKPIDAESIDSLCQNVAAKLLNA
jgi:signal transduction histidine kinase/CheY-like chemotaxis protein/tetratricopeptide (TPR) repeat protein